MGLVLSRTIAGLDSLITDEGDRPGPRSVTASKLTKLEGACVEILRKEGVPLTNRQLAEKLKAQGVDHGGSTLRNALARLGREGLLTGSFGKWFASKSGYSLIFEGGPSPYAECKTFDDG